jgi:2-iminoacetate synthase ThiH
MPDENASNDDYTGVEVLRAIALARLLLPENVQIVAPLTTIGPKLAQVALDFGATHLGYVGSNGEPLEGPLAVNVDELKELQQSNAPTALKEET